MIKSQDWPTSDQGVFAISVAAELSGLHPQTLRTYEREGLLDPGRSDGGTRLYSGEDVQKAREIAVLTGAGLNVPGVRMVLELQAQIKNLTSEVNRLDARLKRNIHQRTASRSKPTP